MTTIVYWYSLTAENMLRTGALVTYRTTMSILRGLSLALSAASRRDRCTVSATSTTWLVAIFFDNLGRTLWACKITRHNDILPLV